MPGSSYKKEYCNKLIEHMEQGLSFESFAGVVGVCKQTIYNWEKRHEDFKKARQIAIAKCQLFWEQLGIDGTLGRYKNFNATSWIFNMKNRFGWGDEDTVFNLFKKKG